jgi:hypothetical protein
MYHSFFPPQEENPKIYIFTSSISPKALPRIPLNPQHFTNFPAKFTRKSSFKARLSCELASNLHYKNEYETITVLGLYTLSSFLISQSCHFLKPAFVNKLTRHRDRTFTRKRGPASLDAHKQKRYKQYAYT